MKRFIVIFVGLIFLGGCGKARHMDQLLTLKGLADEQERLSRYIEDQDKKFDLLLSEFKAGTLEQYSNKRKIRRTFGEPVYVRQVMRDQQKLESWLYRYATEFFGAQKVYLYFDDEGNLVESEYKEGEDG